MRTSSRRPFSKVRTSSGLSKRPSVTVRASGLMPHRLSLRPSRQADEVPLPALEVQEEQQVVAQLPRQEEILAHPLPSVRSQPLRITRLLQEMPDPVGRSFD